MVQTIQAKEITLLDLETNFGLQFGSIEAFGSIGEKRQLQISLSTSDRARTKINLLIHLAGGSSQTDEYD
ncbi:MAG: hypothetical protein SAL70_44120 [Scytonema sp. PMC 1070.18]|nr:hypothetical protein [Scytonema sp. PMC 1070.18]